MKLLKDLLQRRVPQILGIYLGTSWAIIEFLDWLINQFSISPHLPKFVLLTLVSMIPTVLLLAYYHGKPGKDEWTKVEKIGIPTNVLAVILMLIFVFSGKDLGATTSLVTLENEEGQVVERVVPKSEFRKKIMLFLLDNSTGDTTLHWLSYGIVDMLYMDLLQDFYLEVKPGYHQSAIESIKEAGYEKLSGLPLMLEKEITQDLHLDYFLTGSFSQPDQDYQVDAQLYRSRNGKLIAQISIRDNNIYGLVDQLSVQLKRDLEIPDYHIEEAVDLPVSELTTSSMEAYESYIRGSIESLLFQDWNSNLNHLNQAIQSDSTYAVAYLNMYQLLVHTNQSDKAGWVFDPLMRYLYKMPERLQYYAKASYYESRQEYEKQYAMFNMLVSLYPEDIQARLDLIITQLIQNQLDKAIDNYLYILELDPERYSVLREIGSLYEQQGNYEEAKNYYMQYAERFPDRPESFRSLGKLYRTMGDFEEARIYYEKSLLLDPGSISDMLLLADLESGVGNFDQAFTQLQYALDQSETPRENALVYAYLQEFHELRGAYDRALEYLYLKQLEWEKFLTPIQLTAYKIGNFDHYVRLEGEDVATDTLEVLGSKLDAVLKDYASVGYLHLYLYKGQMEKAEEELICMEALISDLKLESLRPLAYESQGKIHELGNEYEQAVDQYLERLETGPVDTDIYVSLGRCYRKLSNHKDSEEFLQKALVIDPFYPDANYEMALFYREAGKNEKALYHMMRVVSIWEHADDDFEPAIRARALLSEWEGS